MSDPKEASVAEESNSIEPQATTPLSAEQESVSNNAQSNGHVTAEQPASKAPAIENHQPGSNDACKENTEEENTEDNTQTLHTDNSIVDIVTDDHT